MANPFARSNYFHRLGHVTNTVAFRILPLPAGIAVITTTGRKSGKKRVRAIRAVRDGSHVYAVSILGPRAAWVANIRANPAVKIKLGGKTYEAAARCITDPADLEHAAAVYRPIAGWYDYADYANFVWDIPTGEKLLRAHDKWFEKGTPVVFELQEVTT